MTTPAPSAPAAGSPRGPSAELLRDPEAAYARLREQAPVAPLRSPDGSLIWLVTRFEHVRAILADPRFANNPTTVPCGQAPQMQVNAMRRLGVPENLIPYLADTLLDNDGPAHARLRRLVSREFTMRRVHALRPRIEQITDALLDALPGHIEAGAVDLLPHFAYPLPITVICELVGVPPADHGQWLRWSHDLAFHQDRMAATLGPLVDYCHALVQRRRADPADDLLSGLVHAAADEDGDRLSDRELVTMVLSLVIAGHDTTANFIANSVVALLTHPDQLAALRADPALLPQAVQELLRWCTPVLVSRIRYVTEDVDLGDGVRFTAGDAVMTVLSSANHDPREFPDADRLDLRRRPSQRSRPYVSFGGGLHHCLGAALAQHEAEIALGRLLVRYPRLALARPAAQLSWQPMSGMRKLVRLPLTL